MLGLLCRLGGEVAQACPGQDRLLAQAAAHFNERQDRQQAQQACELFDQALRQDPACPDAAVGLARAAVWLGVSSEGDEERQAYLLAGQAGQRLLESQPRQAAGHYWLGVALRVSVGNLWEAPPLVERAKSHLRQALVLASAYWLNHLYLAGLLRDEGRADESRRLLAQLLAGPAPAGQEAEYHLWHQQALRLWRELTGR